MLLTFQKKIKLSLLFIISVLFLSQESFAQTEAAVFSSTEVKQAVLQGAISVQPQPQPTQYQTDKIQPGHSVKLFIVVENIGNAASPPDQIYIRYAFAKPLDKNPNSVLFETEKIDLPVIQPGSSIEIVFDAEHKWPSLPDFIRNDWGMREYQALVDGKMIGTLAITFSSYYYPGIRKEIPQAIVGEK